VRLGARQTVVAGADPAQDVLGGERRDDRQVVRAAGARALPGCCSGHRLTRSTTPLDDRVSIRPPRPEALVADTRPATSVSGRVPQPETLVAAASASLLASTASSTAYSASSIAL
jgi:hypothetical protein